MYLIHLPKSPNYLYGLLKNPIPLKNSCFKSHFNLYKQRLVLLVAVFFAICFSSAQAFSQKPTGGEWTLLKKEGNVKFFYKIGKCDKESALMLRISNEGRGKINGTWTLNLHEETNTVQFLGVFEDMAAGFTKTGSCKSDNPYLLIPYKVHKKNPPKISVDIQLARQ